MSAMSGSGAALVLALDPLGPVDAVGDCEWRPGGPWRQPVNAASSLAYVVVAADLARRVVRGGLRRPGAVLAGLVALEGAGSLWYHAGSGPGAQLLHDLPLLGTVGFLAGRHLDRAAEAAGRSGRARWAAAPVVLVVAGGLLGVVAPGAVPALIAATVATVAGAEVLARSRGGAPVWDRALLGLAAAAGLAWLAGRGDSPLCDPGSVLQPHALWHVGTALVLAGWARRALAAPAGGHR